VRATLRTLTWKVPLYLVAAVLIAGLTRDRLLAGLLTVGFVLGDRGVASILRAKAATGVNPGVARAGGSRGGRRG
jgi:hypothetical protein